MAATEDQVWRVAEMTTLDEDALCDILAGDAVQAAPWVKACAAMGIPEAQVRLGRMLVTGEGVAQDQNAALCQFESAAAEGDADAINMLGRCFEMGWGAAINMERAAACYGEAAEAGHAWAQYNYGHMLLDGQGVARNPVAAFDAYSRAATQGHARAMNLVGRCLEEGWGVARDVEAACDWYRRSAEADYFRGSYNYASMLSRAGNKAGARLWLKRALETAPEPTRSLIEKALSSLTLSQNCPAIAGEGAGGP